MVQKSKKAFIIIWSLILLAFLIGLIEITIVLVGASHENILSLLGVLTALMWFLSVFVGFFLTYLMIGPWLLNKHDHRSFRESYIGLNAIFIESELITLALKNDDPSIYRTRKLISFSKYSVVINLVLCIIFFALS